MLPSVACATTSTSSHRRTWCRRSWRPRHCRQRGLHIPLVYNTGGDESMVSLSLLDGVIAIYMPDMKYADAACAALLQDSHYPASIAPP